MQSSGRRRKDQQNELLVLEIQSNTVSVSLWNKACKQRRCLLPITQLAARAEIQCKVQRVTVWQKQTEVTMEKVCHLVVNKTSSASSFTKVDNNEVVSLYLVVLMEIFLLLFRCIFIHYFWGQTFLLKRFDFKQGWTVSTSLDQLNGQAK